MLINGTSGSDAILGTLEADVINAGGGHDTVDAGDGFDKVNAGNGNDLADGGPGWDELHGGGGNDTLKGREGFDALYGGNGNDHLDGGDGQDYLVGGNGDDVLNGGAGRDHLHGGNGDDIAIYAASENVSYDTDIYEGGNGQDTLRLVLTGAEWARGDVRSATHYFLNAMHGGDHGPFHFYAFGALNLEARGFEHFELIVDGVQVDPVIRSIEAVNDNIAGYMSYHAKGNVLANDILPFPVQSVSLLWGTQYGDLEFNADGSFTYFSSGNGEDSGVGDYFAYEVKDTHGDTSAAIVSLSVSTPLGVFAGDDFGTVSEDGPAIVIGLLGNDHVENYGSPLSFYSVYAPSMLGTVVDNGDGSVTYNPNGAFEALKEGETATETFSYSVVDLVGGGSASALVTVTIEGHDELAALAINSGIAFSAAEDATRGETGLVESLTLKGGNADDTLTGGSGDDTISGGNGADVLVGGAGDDIIKGGTGQDLLDGGRGDDALSGGVGADTFRFKPGFGHDTIDGFRLAGADHDTLEFDLGIFADAAALFAHSDDTVDGVLVTADGGDTLLIKNASLAQFHAHPEDFHFA